MRLLLLQGDADGHLQLPMQALLQRLLLLLLLLLPELVLLQLLLLGAWHATTVLAGNRCSCTPA
jgi:hypothetical protein